jgi:hypothetical protein
MLKKLSILHFNILEKYPPAMNFILDVLSQKSEYRITVFTSVNSSPYNNKIYNGVKIFRLGSVSKKPLIRYASYILYNVLGTIILILERPATIVVYETWSILPAFVFSKIFKKSKIHIHYHEYISNPEKEAASVYLKFLFKFEKELLKSITCSQTNEDRRALYLMDNPNLDPRNVSVYPNFPPKQWWSDYGQYKSYFKGGIIKLVYVGVLDSETMYLEEILTWVKSNSETLVLTLYSQQYSEKTNALIIKHSAPNIFLKPAINYYELPQELVKYDVGLVLYKGHIPNYVYNVPNKVYEYLSCGLNVLVGPKLISPTKLRLPQIQIIDFNSLDIDLVKAKLKISCKFKPMLISSTKLVEEIC